MCNRRRGFTLVELVVLIAVLAVALVGVLIVFQNTVRASADPQVRKQAIAVAEALLDEILLASYDVIGIPPAPPTDPRRAFDDVRDYHSYNRTGIVDLLGAAIPGLGQYSVNVSVVPATLSSTAPCAIPCPVNEALLVTVRVTGPGGTDISLDGYRTRYAGP